MYRPETAILQRALPTSVSDEGYVLTVWGRHLLD